MKETLQEKLARRKYKIPNKFVYCTLNKLIINPFLAPKFHPTYHIIDNINDYKGPCFLIYNHQFDQQKKAYALLVVQHPFPC